MSNKCDYQLRGVDAHLWQRLKVYVAKQNSTIRKVIIDAITEYLTRHD